MLANLSLHYWRPDFSPSQAKLLVRDYLEDLSAFSLTTISNACKAYRRVPENKFFPHPGALIDQCRKQSGIESVSRLKPYVTPPEMLEEVRKPLRSAADILREHGHAAAADRLHS